MPWFPGIAPRSRIRVVPCPAAQPPSQWTGLAKLREWMDQTPAAPDNGNGNGMEAIAADLNRRLRAGMVT